MALNKREQLSALELVNTSLSVCSKTKRVTWSLPSRTNCATAVLRKNSSRDGFQHVVMMETAETSNDRLVAQRDDFQVQRCAGANEKAERVKQRNDDGRHDCRLSEKAHDLNRRNTYKVLGRHNVTRRNPFAIQLSSESSGAGRSGYGHRDVEHEHEALAVRGHALPLLRVPGQRAW